MAQNPSWAPWSIAQKSFWAAKIILIQSVKESFTAILVYIFYLIIDLSKDIIIFDHKINKCITLYSNIIPYQNEHELQLEVQKE